MSPTAQDFPHPILAPGQTKYERNSFLVIGGQTTGGELLDKIYLYNNMNDTWILMPARLGQKEASVSATWVDRALFPSCSN